MNVAVVLAGLSHADALLALPFVAAVAAVALRRRRRPLTRQRITDVALASTLLVFLAIRYGVLAAIVLAAPRAVLGPSPEGFPAAVVGVYLLAFAAGLFSWHGGVGRKVLGAMALAVVTLFEVGANLLVLEPSPLTQLDTSVAVAVAVAVLVMTAFHWTRRTATPNPLGGKGPPFSY